MTDAAKKLLEEFLALPEEDQRWFLREVGGVASDDELHPDWIPEIQRRVERAERGETKPIPWDEVEARVRRSLDDV